MPIDDAFGVAAVVTHFVDWHGLCTVPGGERNLPRFGAGAHRSVHGALRPP
ncbi:hypothetical protein BRPE64_BCDS06560 [Caballeronia insecticola]|uniref:Uncharacterized protein n=1 Tax=Caballeronia insecticola TaxID=758793 RepID=R4X211_9BURK|nr:hypothetical protein BRPE64_BCDS06560 [Caballeronia insecticola]